MHTKQSILLLDNNAPWVRSLFKAIAATGIDVYAFDAQSVGAQRGTAALLPFSSWQTSTPHYFHRTITVPGWTRFFQLSTTIATAALRRWIKRNGRPSAVMYTLPHYAAVAEAMAREGIAGAYYAHDPFLFYDWNPKWTAAMEMRMLHACRMSFAISQLLCDDLAYQTDRPVLYSPNAVSRDFIARLQQPQPIPADVQALSHPIIGCTGQINDSYDWGLIEQISRAFSEATLLFVGPVAQETETINRVLKLPNVRWLGKRPHEHLPAYLGAFDICLNPLRVNDHNDRRSPLRLYDYLATDKPIVSTAVNEAYIHEPFVHIGQNAEQCIRIIQSIGKDGFAVDLSPRRQYIVNNTWEQRAQFFLDSIAHHTAAAAKG